jgi:hypothetical protein
MQKKIFLFFILFLPTKIFPNELSLNFLKAKNLYLNKKINDAEIILKKNVTGTKSHFPSLLLLSKIFSTQKKYSKSLKVYFFLIKKLHTTRLLNLKKLKSLQKELELIKIPHKNIKYLYFLMAQTFWEAYSSKMYSQRIKNFLIFSAYKYYKISDYYKIKKKETTFQLAIIQALLGETNLAITNLTLLKKMIHRESKQEEKASSPHENLSKVEIMLSQILINAGQHEEGLLLANKVKKRGTHNSTRALQQVLKKSRKHASKFTFTYGKIFDSNLYDTTNESERSQSLSTGTSIDYFFRSKRKKEWSYTLGLTYNHEEMAKVDYNELDSRSFAMNIGFIKNKFYSYVGKLNYAISYGSKKVSPTGPFKTNLAIHSLTSEILFSNSNGSTNWQAHLKGFDYKNNNDSIDIGIKRSYTPFGRTRLFFPTYSVELNHFKNISLSSPTTELLFSFMNSSQFYFLNLNLSSTLEYFYQSHNLPRNNLHQVNLESLLTIPLKVIKNLYFHPSIKYEFIKKEANNIISKWKARAFITLSF